MNQSGRIKLITEIANKLSIEEWAIIDLTLSQFGLPTSEQWGGEKADYVIAMIQSASDQILSEFVQHLQIDLPENSKTPLLTPDEVMDLIRDIEAQKSLMITVATGGQRIQQVNTDYTTRAIDLSVKLRAINIIDPNPFPDLWSWYAKWSDGSLPSYQSRRNYIGDLYKPVVEQLTDVAQGKNNRYSGEPTGWIKVDRTIDKVSLELAESRDEEDFQTVGLLCREVLISLAQAVYDPSLGSLDGVPPSETDAKRKLEAYIAAKLSGSSNEEFRRYARTGIQLAVVLQHKRSANFRDAALCVEATRSLVNTIAILDGIRDP